MAVYAHELSHNLNIPDNYNNPFTAPSQRTASGMWDMMSRGSFNGPGGQHTRWQIPPTQGSALGAQHNMRNKRFLNFIGDNDLLRLNRSGLAQTGLAVAEVKAREVAPAGDLAGVRVNLDTDGDRNKICLPLQAGLDPTCEGPWRTSPTAAVRAASTTTRWRSCSRSARTPSPRAMASWSASRRPAARPAARYSCFVWYIDSNPQDIDQVDFVRPDGTSRRRRPAMSASSTTARSTPASTPAASTSTSPTPTSCTSTSSTSAPTRRASCTTRSASARSTAPGPQTRGVALATPKPASPTAWRPARSR